jgi:acid phosphatase type 7
MFLHVGDMAYNSGLDSEFQGRFFEMYQDTLRNTVCWPAMGNHEGRTSKGMDGVGPYYDCYVCPTKGEAGGVPSGREAYYSFDFGNIHFVILDSCNESFNKKHQLTPLGDAMMEWLKEDLEKTQAEWLITYFHHPPYTKGSHNSDKESDYESIVMREKFLPLLESAGVDLVLAGHSHIYERSMLIDGAYATPTVANHVVIDDGDGDPSGDGAYVKSAGLNANEGTIAIVTGNAGTSLKRIGTIPLMKRIILEHGSVLLYVEGDTLRGLMLNKEGVKRDTFALKKSGKVPPRTKIANPKPAPPMEAITSVKADGSSLEKTATSTTAKKQEADGEDDDDEKHQPMPSKYRDLIARNGTWKYQLSGETNGWTGSNYSDTSWQRGAAGFGYGDDDDATKVNVKGRNAVLHLRQEFTLQPTDIAAKLGVAISYDDAFIVYINGQEVARSRNITGSGSSAKVAKPHEANDEFEYFSLANAAAVIKPGKNVIAIEGHNDDPDSSDFSLHPQLILAE